jgi:GNAT superfamily N-acetyltransferase
MMTPHIRAALPTEFERLREIEDAADEMFAPVGIGPFAPSPDHLRAAAVVLVSGDPPVGFASVHLVDGVAHLWQLAVLPSATRHGYGSALVAAVCDWAISKRLAGVTLTTFRDVPWNAPFYDRLGFRVIDDLTPGLAAIREEERTIGDDDFGPRVAMRKDLTPLAEAPADRTRPT